MLQKIELLAACQPGEMWLTSVPQATWVHPRAHAPELPPGSPSVGESFVTVASFSPLAH